VKIRLLAIFLLLATATAFAACPDATNNAGYVLPSSAGGDGSTWSTSGTHAAFSSNPSTPVRGCTYYYATGSYGTWAIPQISGTSVITIQPATVANHGTATGWSSSYAGLVQWNEWDFNGSNASYYTFNGVAGGGPPDWACTNCLIKMNVGSGTVACGLCISAGTISNITLNHVNIAGPGISACGANDSCDLIYFCSSGCSGTYSNWLIEYSYLHDTTRTMLLTFPNPGTGMTIDHSYFARNGTAEHREAWSMSTDSNVVISNNIWEDICESGVIAAVNGAGTASNWQVYGNLFEWTGAAGAGCIINTGVLVIAHSNCPTAQCINTSGWLVYDNVIANVPSGSFLSAFDFENITGAISCENNIWYNNDSSAGPGPSGCGFSNSGSQVADYNWFYGNTPTNDTSGPHDVVGSAIPFQTSSNPNFPNGNWELASQIAGVSLGSPYNVDMLGNGPLAGVFSRGALQFGSSSPVVTSPAGLNALRELGIIR